MQQTASTLPAALDADTVLQMHRLVSPTSSPPGLIGDALAAGRLDVLDILHAAGEFERSTVAAACYTRAVDKRDQRALNWLISKGLKPAKAWADDVPTWLGLEALAKGGLWQEGLRSMLEAGVLGIDDRVARDFLPAQPLLQFVLANKGDALACAMLRRGAKAGVDEMQAALTSGCAAAAGLIAERIDRLTLADLWNLRTAMDKRPIPGLMVPEEVAPRVAAEMKALVDALAARTLDVSETPPASLRSGRSAFWAMEFISALREFDSVQQIRTVVQRHPIERDELLRCACRADAPVVAKVLLEEGARIDATEGGRRPVVVPGGVLEREYSPYALHNAMSASVMRLLVDHGADLQAQWQGKKVLHWAIDNFKGRRAEETIAAGKAVFEFLAQQDVDFAEGANGRTVKQLAAHLCDDLKRHLMAIRTGARISSAMVDTVDMVDTPAQRASPGVL